MFDFNRMGTSLHSQIVYAASRTRKYPLVGLCANKDGVVCCYEGSLHIEKVGCDLCRLVNRMIGILIQVNYLLLVTWKSVLPDVTDALMVTRFVRGMKGHY